MPLGPGERASVMEALHFDLSGISSFLARKKDSNVAKIDKFQKNVTVQPSG